MDDPILRGWLLVLFGACGLYACFLARIREWYEPTWTVLTVIGGCGLILAAQYGIEWMGVALTGHIALATNLAGGIPITLWQAAQGTRRWLRNGGLERLSAALARFARGGRA